LYIYNGQIGYIPAENVETPLERLARLNSVRNVRIALVTAADLSEADKQPNESRPNIRINEVLDICVDYDADYYNYDEEDGEEYLLEDDEEQDSADSSTDAANGRTNLDNTTIFFDMDKPLPVRNTSGSRVTAATIGQRLFQVRCFVSYVAIAQK
jgi:hypothetical protein